MIPPVNIPVKRFRRIHGKNYFPIWEYGLKATILIHAVNMLTLIVKQCIAFRE